VNGEASEAAQQEEVTRRVFGETTEVHEEEQERDNGVGTLGAEDFESIERLKRLEAVERFRREVVAAEESKKVLLGRECVPGSGSTGDFSTLGKLVEEMKAAVSDVWRGGRAGRGPGGNAVRGGGGRRNMRLFVFVIVFKKLKVLIWRW
jgi:hypothetical protein